MKTDLDIGCNESCIIETHGQTCFHLIDPVRPIVVSHPVPEPRAVLRRVEVGHRQVLLVRAHRWSDRDSCRTQVFDEKLSPELCREAAAANPGHLMAGQESVKLPLRLKEHNSN